jgi:hypothetical protein
MIVFASSHREHPGELVALALPEPTSSPTTTQDAPP